MAGPEGSFEGNTAIRYFAPALGAGLLALGFAGTAQATLMGRLPSTPGGTDYQAYYDDVADLTWLADANAWAAGLDIDGVTGWRLPDTLQPDPTCSLQSGGVSSGSGCTGSEMGNLFYNVLGGTAGTSIATTHNANYDLFSDIQADLYWSGSEFSLATDDAWDSVFYNGNQTANLKASEFSAWAVRSGDVAAQSPGAVPEPPTVLLPGAGLAALLGRRRRRRP